VVRIDLEALAVDRILDLARYHPLPRTDEHYDAIEAQLGGANLRGFIGGAAWGRYGLLFPHRNDRTAANDNQRPHSSLLVRIDLNTFSPGGVSVLDLASVHRQQVPSIPEPALRGFLHGFVSGAHAYLVPHFSRVFFGYVVRVDMRDFEFFAALQRTAQSTDVPPIRRDGFQTDGVHFVDLERDDAQLVGFSGGYASRSATDPAYAAPRDLASPLERAEWRTVLREVPLGDGPGFTSTDLGVREAISDGLVAFCEHVRLTQCYYSSNGNAASVYSQNKWTYNSKPCPCRTILGSRSTYSTEHGYAYIGPYGG
jgi:hypothetical protein